MLTAMQSAAIVALWRTSHFDTLDIARLLAVPEPDVVVLLDAVRDAERGEAIFALVEGGLA
ncbi:hypothetical protein E3C22_18095 [Jiella endophytica]|uniref:Uncharacterized protein n=1 Tax=Jiella endophytica TaxID=2558362 RepID=A0A4Y8RF07_9HYPH|nr:hypothetical protein [Jiella endophytica]TFF20801.1 hypothetical protein E3C22_18095 [Jiella endophytica]